VLAARSCIGATREYGRLVTGLLSRRHFRLMATLACALCLSCTSADAGKMTEASGPLPDDFDNYYGVYLNGMKVGWMRTQFHLGRMAEQETTLRAQVGGMGTVSKVGIEEKRSYRLSDGALQSLSFSQTASTGSVRISGKTKNGQLHLVVEAGSVRQEQTVAVKENLRDALASDRLAKRARVGESVNTVRFDASVQQNLRMQFRVEAVEQRTFGGVTVRAVKMKTSYPDLGVTEESWLDNQGKVLESHVGGFFVARLEPQDQAKSLDYQQDLLVSAVVHTPRPMTGSESMSGVRLHFEGFGKTLPPSSMRQRVEDHAGKVTLTLHRDPQPPPATFPVTGKDIPREDLEATPFIQSKAAPIIEAARRAVGDTHDIATASTRLTNYVYKHIRDEYVPAYSNALEALESARGDCTEHSILYVGLARAIGIPARVAVGIAYWPPGNGFGWHAWSEIWVKGRWYSVDPTWNQPVADATHIKLAGGGPAQQARIVMLLGKLRISAFEVL